MVQLITCSLYECNVGGRWSGIIVVNVHASLQDKDDIMDSIYEEI